MGRILSIALVLLVVSGARAWAAGEGSGAAAEENLLSRIHRLDEQEMRLGRLAQERGDSRLVRRLGARLESDHDDADARLLRRAGRRGLGVAESGASAEERGRAAMLRSLRGADFDRAFAETVEQDQARGAALLRAERSVTPDGATRREVDRLLPLLDEHRQLAAFARGRE